VLEWWVEDEDIELRRPSWSPEKGAYFPMLKSIKLKYKWLVDRPYSWSCIYPFPLWIQAECEK
jgi:hypothetical protein